MLQNITELYGKRLSISVVVIKADSTDVAVLFLCSTYTRSFYGFDKIGYVV